MASQKSPIQLRVSLKILIRLIENPIIVTVFAINIIGSVFNFLGFTVFGLDLFFRHELLDIIAKLLINVLAILLCNTPTIFLKRLVDRSVCRAECQVTLLENHMASDDAADRERAANDRRPIKLRIVNDLMGANDQLILLVVFFRVNIRVLRKSLFCRVKLFVGFVLDFTDLGRSFAGHNRASDHTDDTSDDEDLRTTLPELKSGSTNHTGCLFHNFVRFHFDSFQLIGVTRGILISHSPRTSKISASRRSDHPYFVSV